jgi:hypothetical protein
MASFGDHGRRAARMKSAGAKKLSSAASASQGKKKRCPA